MQDVKRSSPGEIWTITRKGNVSGGMTIVNFVKDQ